MNKILASVAALFLAMTGLAGVAHAQQAQTQAQAQTETQTQTQPGVARVSLINGDVSMQRGDTGDWVAVTVNTPLLSGDSISTGPNSRAEVQLDYANVLRLAANSTAKIANLDRKTIQVQVAQGLVNYDVLVQDEAQAEIDTPSVAVQPLGNGRYRIQVDPNNQTLVTVVKGEANISTPKGSTRVEQGQLITIQGVDNPQYRITNAGAQDAWDRWNKDRDNKIYNSGSWRYTDRYYTGAQDLETHGRWVYASDYGWVWTPYGVGPDWAPYRDGRWVWEPYYGWTWVSYQPWGWAPFHYGRWFLYAGDWCWWPGPINYYPGYYPVWAPAYVSFFGFGYGGFNFGFGFGNVGWLPIGPGDYYYPWYGYGRGMNYFNFYGFDHHRYYRRYHGWGPLYRGRHGYSNFDNVMKVARLRHGASWMRASQFGRGPVPRQQRHIDGSAFRQAKVFSGRVPIVPTRASLRVVNRAANPASYRRGVMKNQRFFTNGRTAPRPTSFREQRAQLQRSMQEFRKQGGMRTAANGRPLDANPRAGASGRGPANRATGNSRGFQTRAGAQPGARGTASVKNQNGWQRFGGAARQPTGVQRGATQRNNNGSAARANGAASQRSGWRVFGGANQGSRGNGGRGQQGGQAQPRGKSGGRGYSPSNRNRPAPAQRQQPRQSAWRTFTPSSRQGQSAQRGNGNGRAPAQRQGWQTFTPRSSGQPRNTPSARGRQSAPSGGRGGWQVFRPSSRPSAQGRGGRQSGRQPLNLRQPIVQQRYSPRNGGRSSGGGYYRGGGAGRAPSYRAPRSNPGGYYRGGGGGRAPSYRAPRGNSGGFSRGGGSPRGGSFSRGGSRGGGFRGGSHGGSHGGGHPGGHRH